MTGTISVIESLWDPLEKVGSLLKKDSVVWPYQKLTLIEFTRKYFPKEESMQQIEKFKNLPPEKLLQAVENKLRAIDAILGPLEERMKALEFQQTLLSFFTIFLPKKLKECQEILNRTPRGIREGFTTEKNLDLAIKKGFSQKKVAEMMALWLNMRYYGALSCGLSPKFLISSVMDVESLRTKLESIERTLEELRPKVEKKQEEYAEWVFRKQRIDEERKVMTFGPESVQTLETVLESVNLLSLAGELSQKEAMELTKKVKDIIDEAIRIGEAEKKTFISKEKREKLEKIIQELSEKPRLFFTIAQISNLLEKGEDFKEEHISTLHKIISVIKLLPETTAEAISKEELKKNLRIIFEPLKFLNITEEGEGKGKSKFWRRKTTVKKETELQEDIESELNPKELLKKIFDETSEWFIKRVIAEKKEGLENLIDLFNGIPLGLGAYISQMIMKRVIKINIDKFKECLIGHLGNSGVYELYSQIGKRYKEEAEIEMAGEINIPPTADQRLAPIQKQIKFEFMKYMESAKLNKTPLFNILETHKIPPIKLIDLLLEGCQNVLVSIINANAERKLHELVELDPKEYEIKLKTLSLKLSTLINNFSKILEKILVEEIKEKEFRDSAVFKKFESAIKEIWYQNLIDTKKIEPVETEITTSKVSALAAKLEGGIKREISVGSHAGPPRAPPPSAEAKSASISNTISSLPPRAAPPSAKVDAPPTPSTERPAPPRATPPSAKIDAPPTPSTERLTPPNVVNTSVTIKTNKPLNPQKSIPTQISLHSIKEVEEKPAPQLIELEPIDENQIESDLDSTIVVPDFVKRQKDPNISSMKKSAQLRETLEEAVGLVESSMGNLDKLSPDSLKKALQLVYQLREIEKKDLDVVDPSKVRQVVDFAEALKKSKETIIIQKSKLKEFKTKLNEQALIALDSKLELIAKIFDEFIQELEAKISHLVGKGEKLIIHYGKKGGKDFRVRERFKREGKTLAEEIDVLKKIGELSEKEFNQVKQAYKAFLAARSQKNTKLIKKYSVEISKIINVNRKEFLKITRDPILLDSLEELLNSS